MYNSRDSSPAGCLKPKIGTCLPSLTTVTGVEADEGEPIN